MHNVSEILAYLETLAPAAWKESWDNVGLLCGRSEKPVSKILVALDPFRDVVAEAIAEQADLLVTHHPLIFGSSLVALTDATETGRNLLALAEHGIAAINAHTNWDVAPCGVNYILANTLNLQNISLPFPTGCDPDGNPVGLLRRGEVPAQPLETFLSLVKERLGCPMVRYADGGRPVHMVAVGGGACASELAQVAAMGCDTFVTSDVKYNQFWDARDLGISIIDAGHFYTEDPAAAALGALLAAAFPDISVQVSKKHRDCMKFF